MASLHANIPLKYEFLIDELKELNQLDFFMKVRTNIFEGLFSSKTFNQFGKVVEIKELCKNEKCKISFEKRRGYTIIIFQS